MTMHEEPSKSRATPGLGTCCVIVTGTNAVGKSSVARAFIARFGGVSRYERQVSFLNGDACLAGPYDCSSGGVDRLKDAEGNTRTSVLADVVEAGLSEKSTILCEGSRLDTFGINLTNALFKARRQLVVNLFADEETIRRRLHERSGDKKRAWGVIFRKQIQAHRAADKFRSIGVPVMRFDTRFFSPERIVEHIIGFIEGGGR